MKKKQKRLSIALLGLIFVLALVNEGANAYFNEGKKTIQIIIKDEKKVLYDDKVETKAKVLGDLLIEMKENKEIVLEYEDSTYGMYIKGMGKDKLHKEDVSASKYWVYDSENNKSCKEADLCDSANKLAIEDNDVFVFTLKSFNE